MKLLDERIVTVQPSLVRAVGLTCAVVLQQIHWHLGAGHGEELDDGATYAPLPLKDFEDETGLTRDQIRKALRVLEELAVVKAASPGGYDRTKWYSVDYQHVLVCPSGDTATCKGPEAHIEAADSPPPPSKTPDTSNRSIGCELCEWSGVRASGVVCGCFLKAG